MLSLLYSYSILSVILHVDVTRLHALDRTVYFWHDWPPVFRHWFCRAFVEAWRKTRLHQSSLVISSLSVPFWCRCLTFSFYTFAALNHCWYLVCTYNIMHTINKQILFRHTMSLACVYSEVWSQSVVTHLGKSLVPHKSTISLGAKNLISRWP